MSVYIIWPNVSQHDNDKSRLSLIIPVNVVLNRTVVVDSD